MTYIIGEMAWSHNGKLENALKILQGLKEANANAVGVHLTDLNTYMTKSYKCLAGQTLSDSADDSLSIYEYLQRINLTNDEWLEFSKRAHDLMIDIVAMCNDYLSFCFSKMIKVKRYVISAACFGEYDLISEIVKYNNNLILRIGGATLAEIDEIIDFILTIDGHSKITLLAGIQLYPTPIEQLHLASISKLKQKYDKPNINIGLADHIDGDNSNAITIPALALAYGVDIFEKHVTTDRLDKLEDYEAALGLKEFKEFVQYISAAELALGSGDIDYLENDSYEKYRNVSRKKIVAARELTKGEVITKEKIAFKRSDHGSQLTNLKLFIGKKLNKNKYIDDGIDIEDLD